MEVLNKYGIYKSVIRTLLEHAVPVLQNINMYIGQNIRKCAEKSHEYYISYASLSTEQALAAASLTTLEERRSAIMYRLHRKVKMPETSISFSFAQKELIVPNYNLRSRSNFRIFWPAEVSSSAFAGQPASKLSCLGEQSEPRENARGRDRGKESLQRSLLNFHFQPRDSAKRENCHRKRAAD